MIWDVKRLVSLLILLSFICYQPTFAKTKKVRSKTPLVKNGWAFGIGAGIAWPRVKNSTNVANGNPAPPPNNMDNYSMQTRPAGTAMGAVSMGYNFVRNSKVIPRFSITGRYQRLTKFRIQGQVQQYSLPSFTNYTYQMRVSSNIFTVQGQMDLFQAGRLTPYVSGGVGIASTSVWGYHEQALPGVIPRDDPSFKDNIINNFTYNVGVGINFKINSRWLASLGYEYANLGRLKTHAGGGLDWMGESLSFGTLTTQTALFNMSYQFS